MDVNTRQYACIALSSVCLWYLDEDVAEGYSRQGTDNIHTQIATLIVLYMYV